MENAESVPDGYINDGMKLNRKVKINLRFGETAKIVCDEGYILHGTDSVTCTQHDYLRVPMCMPIELDCQCKGKIFISSTFKIIYYFVKHILVNQNLNSHLPQHVYKIVCKHELIYDNLDYFAVFYNSFLIHI